MPSRWTRDGGDRCTTASRPGTLASSLQAAAGDDLRGWTPTALTGDPAAPTVEWRRLGTRRIADPFFDETVLRAMSERDIGDACRHTDLERLREVAEASPRHPSGWLRVFHVSRCGSTLVSQMLAAVPTTVVLSEVPAVDVILRAPAPEAERARRLRWLLGALGHRRLSTERALYVKLACWQIADLPILASAFPGVPWIFVYREPVEVLASHAREPGMQVVRGLIDASRLGVDPRLPRDGAPRRVPGAHPGRHLQGAALRAHARGAAGSFTTGSSRRASRPTSRESVRPGALGPGSRGGDAPRGDPPRQAPLRALLAGRSHPGAFRHRRPAPPGRRDRRWRLRPPRQRAAREAERCGSGPGGPVSTAR